MKKILSLMIVCMLLLFAGCSGSSNSTSPGGAGSTFNGGTQGLEIEVLENPSVNNVRDNGGSTFFISMGVSNVGEYAIPTGETHVSINDVDRASFNIQSTYKQDLPELRGVKKQGKNVIPGTNNYQVTFQGMKYLTNEYSGSRDVSIPIDICYPYKTRAVTRLCVDKNPYDSDSDYKVCEVDEIKEVSNSGAPVEVIEVKQNVGSESIELQFTIQHHKDGVNTNVYKPNSLTDECGTPDSSSLTKNVIAFEVGSDVQGMICNGGTDATGEILLDENNQGTAYCSQPITSDQEFEKPYTITLSYDYLQRETQTITVQHIE